MNKKIPLWIYLFLIFIAFANTEILTGSAPVTSILSPFNFLSLFFYGFLFLIYIDLVEKYNFDALQIFILGMMHGIFEEGISLWTFFFGHPLASPLPMPGDLPGFRLTWSLQTMIGESFLVVVLGILLARILIPYEKRKAPLLSKKAVIIMGLVVLLVSIFFNIIVLKVVYKAFPLLIPYLLTWALFIGLGIFLFVYQRYLKGKIHRMLQKGKRKNAGYAILSFFVMVGYTLAMLGMEKNPYPLNKVMIATGFIGLPGLFLTLYAWSDEQITKAKLAIVFGVFLLFFTLIFIPVRVFINTPVMFAISLVEIYLVIRAVRAKT